MVNACQIGLDGDHYGFSDLVLYREDVLHVQFTIVAVGPQMTPVGGVNQLCGDSQARAGSPNATFEDEVDAEVFRDFADVGRPVLEEERGRARDHAQTVQPG